MLSLVWHNCIEAYRFYEWSVLVQYPGGELALDGFRGARTCIYFA